MASFKAAWGIEVGAYAIKAIRLERVGDEAKLTDFAVIPHKKVLTTPDLDQDEMIRLGLGQFVSQKKVEGEHCVISVPGNTAFARFAKLPPVEPRKVPDIVKFEAVQQIPFPIEEVEWDYETFEASDSPEIEVGIFAITKERLNQRLALYAELGINADIVTISPLAVFNALSFDLDLGPQSKPIVFLDIGTSSTDLIVADEGRCWIRTFPVGGTSFTDAIAESFKLNYGKADALKQESATSKYAKQIMQAMRPVFTDLLTDVQKSLNYYQQLHRGVHVEQIIGLGSTFKIPGLRKFLGQQLNLEVVRHDEFRKIRIEGREAADFAANTVNMATAYGLALQSIGLAPIDVNLAPVKALRDQMWAAKTKWFAGAAAVAVAAAGLMFVSPIMSDAALESAEAKQTDQLIASVLAQGKKFQSEYRQLETDANLGFRAENLRRLTDDRRVWPALVDDVASSLAAARPQLELLGESAELIQNIPSGERRNITLENLAGAYSFPNGARRIKVTMDVTFTNAGRQDFLNDTVVAYFRELRGKDRPDVPYKVISEPVFEVRSAIVGDDGTIKMPEMPSTPTQRDEPQRPPEGEAPPEDGGGGGRGLGGGNKPGKRTTGENVIARPGAGLGFGNSDEEAGSSNATRGEDGVGGGGANDGIRRGGSTGANEPLKFDVDGLAPVPSSPSLVKKGDTVFRGVVTFEIELAPVSGAPADGQEQPQQ
ncbi:MAG: type IV pilus assembly protein PilM [Phycisphaerae bacterium]|jgi:type IV pilus assembly protein PilM|nr:type IV pilus assembly protein PilM [Phycisphaerae bacterium]